MTTVATALLSDALASGMAPLGLVLTVIGLWSRTPAGRADATEVRNGSRW